METWSIQMDVAQNVRSKLAMNVLVKRLLFVLRYAEMEFYWGQKLAMMEIRLIVRGVIQIVMEKSTGFCALEVIKFLPLNVMKFVETAILH